MQLKNLLGAAALALAFPALAATSVTDAPYGAILGKYVKPDSQRDADYGVGAHLIYGIPLATNLDLELNGFAYDTERQSSTEDDYGYGGGLDLRASLYKDPTFSFFLLLGGGALGENIIGEKGVSPYGNAGLGFTGGNFFGVPELSFRADARYVLVDRKDSSGFDSAALSADNYGDIHFNVGVQLAFFTPPPPPAGFSDSDGDGVIDEKDDCPGTAPGTKIDGRGCALPLDGDGDGIVDADDRCPDTPAGVAVDATGCPLPMAVPTPLPPPRALPPPPARPIDSDGDGVPDGMDQCPSTPPGFRVDAKGCPLPRDSDNDGVTDAADRCPNTPPGMRVDAKGCAIRQTLVLHNINFASDSDKLTVESSKILDGIAAGLRGQGGMKVQIVGHTDATGGTEHNLKLSKLRALAVKSYLMGKGIAPTRMTTQGYGESKPIAENKTPAGRAQNRRVEFNVLKQ